jgi:leucyl-tRNA synthetase
VVPAEADASAFEAAARRDPRVSAPLEAKTVLKVVVVAGKLINFVIG